MIEKEHIQEIMKQYNNYFDGDKNSLYNKRFGGKRTTLHEESVITDTLKNIINNLPSNHPRIIKILDFGCGDGRIFPIIEKTAHQFKNKDIKFHLVGYDPCETAIKSFTHSLLTHKYSKENEFLTYDNLLVELILGNVADETSVIENKLGNKFDLCLCMYGVLSHIPYRKNRISYLKMINNILSKNGELLLSLCSKNPFSKEVNSYNLIRKQLKTLSGKSAASIKIREELLRLATEEGDIYYCSSNNDKAIDIFTHVYTLKELREDLKSSNFNKNPNIHIMSILEPFNLTHSYLKDKIDKLLSKLFTVFCFTDSLRYFLGKHFYARCKK